MFEHFRFEFDTEYEQATQALPRLVLGPVVVMPVYAGVNLMAIGQVDATNRRVAKNLVIQISQFSLIMFESAHVISIPRKDLSCIG